MTADQFDVILNQRLDKIRETLASKGSEYASPSDRLHNFKRAAAIRGITPAKALEGMWTKHLVSVLDMIDDDARTRLVMCSGVQGGVTRTRIDEKIGDAINYLILLEAVLIERIALEGYNPIAAACTMDSPVDTNCTIDEV